MSPCSFLASGSRSSAPSFRPRPVLLWATRPRPTGATAQGSGCRSPRVAFIVASLFFPLLPGVCDL
eukprot:13360565-Alexandrium_andersonii.AAC.1